MNVTVDEVNFCDGLECVSKAVHQQLVDWLINTWVFAGYNMAINSVRHGFLCNNKIYRSLCR